MRKSRGEVLPIRQGSGKRHESGNAATLRLRKEKPSLPFAPDRYPWSMALTRAVFDHHSTALGYHRRLPARIRTYLMETRGLSEEVICRFLLGWNGYRITIPIKNREGAIVSFRLARDPQDAVGPKMLSTPGSRVALYGQEIFQHQPERIVICEGEFDRLVLETKGFHAVTSTGGAGAFPEEWARFFFGIPEVYVCFDLDELGKQGALRVARLVQHARIVTLPAEVGEKGDFTDYFVRLQHSAADFEALLRQAEPLSEERIEKSQPPKPYPALSPSGYRRVQGAKKHVPIAEVVGAYVKLFPAGRVLMGRCPFHDDRRPSLAVFPLSDTYHCFACGAHGDQIAFLRAKEGLGFFAALDRLEKWRRP
jgi:DNA primase